MGTSWRPKDFFRQDSCRWYHVNRRGITNAHALTRYGSMDCLQFPPVGYQILGARVATDD